MLSHWIKHNDDHAGTYVDWAAKTSAAGLPAIEALLTEAADMTRSISTRFDTALKQLEKGKP